MQYAPPTPRPGSRVYQGIMENQVNDVDDIYKAKVYVLVTSDRKTRKLENSKVGRQHSPDGHHWGYNGSGPAALAHSILQREYGPDFATRHYQTFKHNVIAVLPTNDAVGKHVCWTLTTENIQDVCRILQLS